MPFECYLQPQGPKDVNIVKALADEVEVLIPQAFIENYLRVSQGSGHGPCCRSSRASPFVLCDLRSHKKYTGTRQGH